MTARITIAQLYPELLGVTGDRGNVEALRVRAERAGFEVDVALVECGDALPSADIVVIGNGPLSALRGVADDFRRHRDALAAHVAAGGALLSIGGGAELLSGAIIDAADGTLEGIGILPFRVERRRERRVGYVVAETGGIRLAGFEDHSSVWLPDSGVEPFARVVHGKGTIELAGGRRGEGVRVKNAYALRMQGPLLPLNPALADQILAAVAESHGATYTTTDAHAELDEFAREARAAIESRATQTYNSIGI